MGQILLYVIVLLQYVGCVLSYHTDCVQTASTIYGLDFCSHPDIACQDPYECCGTSCCYKGLKDELYSTPEVVGLVLCATSMATSLVLALVICGATYCNSRDDKSHIFAGRK